MSFELIKFHIVPLLQPHMVNLINPHELRKINNKRVSSLIELIEKNTISCAANNTVENLIHNTIDNFGNSVDIADLIVYAAYNGNIKLLTCIKKNCQSDILEQINTLPAIITSLYNRHYIQLTQCIISMISPSILQHLAIYAAQRDHREVLKYLLSCEFKFTAEIFDIAAEYGHNTLIKWLRINTLSPSCTSKAFDCAAKNGHYYVCITLCKHFKQEYKPTAMNYAISNGYLSIVKLLYINFPHLYNEHVIDIAIEQRRLTQCRIDKYQSIITYLLRKKRRNRRVLK